MSLFIFLILFSEPAQAGNWFRYDADVQGQVVDADTLQPITGVVVMAMWVTQFSRITIEPGERYYDYYEVLTDANGEFTIPGKGQNLFRNMPQAKIKIYKAGYAIRDIRFEPTGYPPDLNITFKDGKRFVSYRKLSADKRKDYVTHYMKVPFSEMARADVPAEKYRLYTTELSSDYQAIGIRPWRPDAPVLVIKRAIHPATNQAVSPKKSQ